MQKGKISVNTENIFPIIKKFLYTDNEIFLRELVSNAVDASQKLKYFASKGDFEGKTNDLKINVKLDEKKKTLTISDMGIGMTAEEIEKYINQIAFSGAEEFVEKYKDSKEDTNIIGHFGLGFYSAFMVADKVEIDTLSYKKDSEPARWTCTGSTDFKITKGKRKKIGTDIILHINEESVEFLDKFKIKNLLSKYAKFLPIAIWFDDENINNTSPIWKKNPADLDEKEYKDFYKELYPIEDEPLFWIHLNVDFPFNLTGVLYFPKLKKDIDPNRNKIQLYSNQVFVTDNVEDIVPDYLMLLHGILDSPDIPLNVSRSSLQADGNVKKITSHISKKVSDKLHEIFKKDRNDFEEKWESMSIFVKYGMINDEKFYDRAQNFALLKDTNNNHMLIDEFTDKIEISQKDKEGNRIALYTNNKEEQITFVQAATKKGFLVLELNEIIDNHLVSAFESKFEKVQFKRVDADSLSKLVQQELEIESTLSDDEKEKLVEQFKSQIQNENCVIETVAQGSEDNFVTITKSEFDRRMREMYSVGGGNPFGQMPEKHNLVINLNHPNAKKILSFSDEQRRKNAIQHVYDLALLSQNMLKGEDLLRFVERTSEKI
ncbi:MAG: molecular chaperone HtpG [Bacteroidetes bacterium MED-G17]|nr:MAG: molecular chaperone HtpG [Bacteroidetes bacterium MED-G17]|tara:strand:+ start:2006 stop:3814 length:1809 start_codon:yes stop_codon:yes gene_type:complete